jgi:hypothetical protein
MRVKNIQITAIVTDKGESMSIDCTEGMPKSEILGLLRYYLRQLELDMLQDYTNEKKKKEEEKGGWSTYTASIDFDMSKLKKKPAPKKKVNTKTKKP